jgi:hypothetical protein
MAESNDNVLTHGLSGTVGGMLVFRQRNGKTIVAKRPVANKNVSEKQAAHREHFQQAVIYGSAAAKAPETKDLYATAAKKTKGVTAFNVAVADYCNAPDIKNVDLSKYAGNVGDTIRIITTDDFAVKAVAVSITNADGSLVEEGEAVQSIGSLWIYTATQINDNLEGDKIVVAVSDLPGNVTRKETEIN